MMMGFDNEIFKLTFKGLAMSIIWVIAEGGRRGLNGGNVVADGVCSLIFMA